MGYKKYLYMEGDWPVFDMKVKTLLAVIESGSYTKAAQKLNLTQPAVSHQIRLLENEFDIKIFYRS